MDKKKVGIIGGTFDPPHIGHFVMADEVKKNLKLDEIWFMPTNIPPHKNHAKTSNMQRAEMLELATVTYKQYKVELIEFERQGASYTFDTMLALKEKYPNHIFYFIIGGDMVEYLPNWYKIDELVNLVQFVGVNRPNYKLETNYKVLFTEMPMLEISSSAIRNRLASGREVKYFLPEPIYAYIKERRLYGYLGN